MISMTGILDLELSEESVETDAFFAQADCICTFKGMTLPSVKKMFIILKLSRI